MSSSPKQSGACDAATPTFCWPDAMALRGARLGIIVQRRFIATAVARNRAKRRLRESFRRHRDQLPALDIVVLAYPELAQSDLRPCAQDAGRSLAQAGDAIRSDNINRWPRASIRWLARRR